MSSRLILLAALPLAACGTLAVQRTARVPHAAVPMHDGQPMEGRVAISAGLDNAVDVKAPTVGNAQESVETPAVQMRDELRFRVGRRGEVGFVYEGGLGAYERPDPTQAPVGQGNPWAGGAVVRYSIETGDPHWSVGIGAEVLFWQIPYVEWTTCVDNCFGNPYTISAHKTNGATTLGLAVTPSYRSGPLTIFGTAFARNHPTVERKTIEEGIPNQTPIENGPLNLTLAVGVSYRFAEGISGLATITQEVLRDPLQYYPGVGVALQLELGEKWHRPEPQPVQTAPPGMVAPPPPPMYPPPPAE
jgi:hypothetical protein